MTLPTHSSKRVILKQVSFRLPAEEWLLLRFISMKRSKPITEMVEELVTKKLLDNWRDDPDWTRSRGE